MYFEKDITCIYNDEIYCINGKCKDCEYNIANKSKLHVSGKNISIQISIDDILKAVEYGKK